MKIYDVTRPVSPTMPVWPGDPPVSLKMVKRVEMAGAVSMATGSQIENC